MQIIIHPPRQKAELRILAPDYSALAASPLPPPPNVTVVTVGIPGPAGGSGFSKTAGETLSALRLVKLAAGQAFYASADQAGDRNSVVGVTQSSAAPGQAVLILTSGPISDSAWAWTPNAPVWLGINGALTQTPPAAPSVFSLQIGHAVSATEIFIQIERPIQL